MVSSMTTGGQLLNASAGAMQRPFPRLAGHSGVQFGLDMLETLQLGLVLIRRYEVITDAFTLR